MYRVNVCWLDPKVEEVDILRKTMKYVYMGHNSDPKREVKEAITSSYMIYSDSWKEAYSILLSAANEKIKEETEKLERLQNKLKLITDMVKVGEQQ
jgi:hypothetical protein